jgi:hypothetical protein
MLLLILGPQVRSLVLEPFVGTEGMHAFDQTANMGVLGWDHGAEERSYRRTKSPKPRFIEAVQFRSLLESVQGVF